MKRWKEYFEDLLNVKNEAIIDKDEEIKNEIIDPPSLEEIRNAIKHLKTSKAPGKDNITTEIIKCGGEEVIKWIYDIIQIIWNNEKVVDEWQIAKIVALFKKGDMTLCDNYRGITLLSIPSKILTRILHIRIQTFIELQDKIHERQCGFPDGKIQNISRLWRDTTGSQKFFPCRFQNFSAVRLFPRFLSHLHIGIWRMYR